MVLDFEWNPAWDRLEACSVSWLKLFSILIEKLRSSQAIGLEVAELATLVRTEMAVAQEWKFAVDQLAPRINWCMRVCVVPGLTDDVMKRITFLATVVLCRVLQIINIPQHLDQMIMINAISDLITPPTPSPVFSLSLPSGCPVNELSPSIRVSILNAITFYRLSESASLLFLSRCLTGELLDALFALPPGIASGDALDLLQIKHAPVAAAVPTPVPSLPLPLAPAPVPVQAPAPVPAPVSFSTPAASPAPDSGDSELVMKLLSDFKASFPAAPVVRPAVPAPAPTPAPPPAPAPAPGGIKQEEGESVMDYLRRYQRLMGDEAAAKTAKSAKSTGRQQSAVCKQFEELGTCFLGDKCENRHPLKL